ncbi:MAG: hypothetical protein M1827_000105 [Pycnora praestabilis]|nr:MAG: hypothetical protein M1827_000105 [Pycnora praestabilis]
MSFTTPYKSNTSSIAKPLVTAQSYPLKFNGAHHYSELPSDFTEDDLERARRQDGKLKKHIRIFRVITRTGTAVLSAFMTVGTSMSFAKYMTTKDHIVDGRNAWAKDTTIWPTLMLLAIAVVTLILNISILISYAHSIKSANRADKVYSYFIYMVYAAHIIAWVVCAGLYRFEKTGHDLWGWSCSDAADKIQPVFQNEVNFNTLCNTQTSSWYASIAEALLELFSLGTYILVFRRILGKKKMDRLSTQSIPAQNF